MAEGIKRNRDEWIVDMGRTVADDHDWRLVIDAGSGSSSITVCEEIREIDVEASDDEDEDDGWFGDAGIEVPVAHIDRLIAALQEVKKALVTR